jgi:hypothetical protein
MPKQSIDTGLALVSFFWCVSCNSQQFATIPNNAKAIVDRAGLGLKMRDV